MGRSINGWAALLAGGCLAATTGDADHTLPRPAPQQRAADFDSAAANAACEGCHPQAATEWRGSLHRQAWSDPVFLSAYAIDPQAFCRSCHAPEADPASGPSATEGAIGVGCVTCHVQVGEVRGARASEGPTHTVLADARMATGAACAGCHQFEFPKPQHAPMQGTHEEHRASPYAQHSCQSCHMAEVRGSDGRSRHRHGFHVAGESDMLRSAIKASAWRTDGHTLKLSLAVAKAGHAVPTGDMFRRLEVRAQRADDARVAAPTALLGRRFVLVPDSAGMRRQQIADTRLPASGEPREVTLYFDEDVRRHGLNWQVVYQRMPPAMARSFGIEPLQDDVILAQGSLPPWTTAPLSSNEPSP